MKQLNRSPFRIAACLCLAFGLTSIGRAQLTDPIPDEIEVGPLVLELEEWVTIPPSSGGTPRARISIFRALPDGRIFVNDLRGKLYRIEEQVPSVYLDLSARLADFMDSPGLGTGFHAFAFHPDFAANGKLYTVHSEPWNAAAADFRGPTAPVNSGGHQSVLVEWTTDDPAAGAFSGTRRELLRIYFPGTIHAMQEIAFNPNARPGDVDYGLLYICNGEGGSYLRGYPDNEHRLDSPMGTIFRIDPLGSNSANGAYGIPADNPWADAADDGILKEIYAYGFRNPHRITWDTGGSGRVYVGDIGETRIEEVNLLQAGGDYGFPEREGTFLLKPDEPENNTRIYPLPANDAEFGYIYPVAQYDHDEGIAVVMGPVYRGSLAADALKGYLLFGDIAWGRVFAVKESDLTLGNRTGITEVQLELDGVAGNLRSFVGNNRADLRWGRDAAGEIYLMTKTDGKIRKVVGARFHEKGAILHERDRWSLAEDFESETGSLVVLSSGTGGSVAVVSDPFGDAANAVLKIDASSVFARLPLALTASGEAGEGSVYFRFALEGQAEGTFGITSQSGVLAPSQASASIVASEAGGLSVYNGGSPETVGESLRQGVWYECWVLFSREDDSFNLYIRGGDWTAPALLGAGLRPRQSMGSGLRGFLLASGSELPARSALYLDDVYADPTALNLSAPVGAHWSLVSNFETDLALDDWLFATPESSDGSSSDIAEVRSELSGNRYLRFESAEGGTVDALALVPLPRPMEVSEVATLYGRVLVEDLRLEQVFGIVNVSAEDYLVSRHEALETSLRFSNATPASFLTAMDSQVYEPVDATISPGGWYDFWMVIRNGGEASGGQTYDVYWSADDSMAPPELVYEGAGFRQAREAPLTHFGIIANAPSGGPGGALWIDDLHLIEGVVLERPNGTGSGMFPGARGGKGIPWFGYVWDMHAPWIYHQDHGWLYVMTPQVEASWFYDSQLEWMWIHPAIYPWIYAHGESSWVYYLEGSRDPRWFYHAGSGEWLSITR